MAILEKRVLLGVQNTRAPSNKPKKKIKKKKHFLKKVVDYLKSDSYLFAPLTCQSNYQSFKGVQVIKKDKENKQNWMKKVGEYLMSDSHMYSPLLVAPSKSFYISPKEAQLHIKRVTAMETTRKSSISSKADNERSAKDSAKKDSFVENLYNERKSLVHIQETMKHAVYENCRASVPEKKVLSSQKRKLF